MTAEQRALVEQFTGDLGTFFQEKWNRQPGIFHSDSDDVRELLTLHDADAILESPYTRPPYVEMTRDQVAVRERIWTHHVGSKSLTIPDAVNVDVLAAEFGKGATLILNHLDDYHNANRRVCAAFEGVFGSVTKTVAFITPPAQQGLGTHYDTFEGFIVQTAGAKRWRVFAPLRPAPTKPKGFREGEVPGEPVLDVTLQPGDVLYVPWGAPHFATTTNSVSCHVTIMVFPPSWREAAQMAIRDAIPPEAFDQLADVTAPGADAETIVEVLSHTKDRLARASMSRVFDELLAKPDRDSGHGGFVGQRSLMTDLSETSVVTREPRIAMRVIDEPETLKLLVDGRTYSLPRETRPAIAALAEAEQLPLSAVSSLPPGHVVRLAELLVGESALRIVQ